MSISDLKLLRLYLNDPSGNNEKFHDDELEKFIEKNDGDLYSAAADGWRVKAATVADWYFVNIDGALLSRDQVWKHCVDMAEFFEGKGAAVLTNVRLDSGFITDKVEASEF